MKRATAAERLLGATLLGATLLGATQLGGCIDDLPSGVLVERPRVLGVRVTIAGSPENAQPRAGEEVTLAWLTVPPEEGWSHALTACVGAPSNQGIPICEGEPFAVGLSPAPEMGPAWTFTVPEDAAGTLLIAGVLCANGSPALPAEGEMLPTCEGEGATRELVTFSVRIGGPGPINQHPEWDEDAFLFEGEPWAEPPTDLGETGCAGRSDLPQVARRRPDEEGVAPEPTEFGFHTRPGDREPFQAFVLADPPMLQDRIEELSITHVATAGRMARLKTDVFDEETEAASTVPWIHPDDEVLPEVPTDGQTVRVWWVIRDGRGGMAMTERDFCLVP